MNLDSIENLDSNEISSLYDDIVENSVNLAQCACGTDGTCSYNGNRSNGGYNFCIAFTHNGTRNYISSDDCRVWCRNNCSTDYSVWWGYVQSGCNDGYNWPEHNPCSLSSGSSYLSICR